jgi:hypothetical protein
MATYVYDKDGKIIAGLNSNSSNFDKYKAEYESQGYKVDTPTPSPKKPGKKQNFDVSSSMNPLELDGKGWYVTPEGKRLNPKYYDEYGNRLITPKATTSKATTSNNTNTIDKQYDQQRKSLVAQLKASIAKAKGGYTDMINKAPQTYQPLRNQTEVSKESQLMSMREALANQGNAGGTGRQELLGINTSAGNQMNDINLQQQNVVNDANSAITSLDEQAAFKESSITADMASQKLQALLGEQTRIDELNRDQTEKAEELKTKMSEDDRQRFIDTIGRYSNDFTAQRNQIRDDGDPSNDWQIPYLEREAQNKRAEAQAKYQRQGYVSEDIAAALGLKVGTMTDAYKMSLQTANQKQLVDNALKLFDDIGYITPQMAQILSAYGLPSDAVSLVKLKQQNTGGSGGGGGGSSGNGLSW